MKHIFNERQVFKVIKSSEPGTEDSVTIKRDEDKLMVKEFLGTEF